MCLARSIIALLVCSLSTLRAAEPPQSTAHGEGASGHYEISVVETVKQHSLWDDVSKECRSGHHVRGCTDFPRESLECHCERQNGAWVLEGQATVSAVIHVASGYPINRVLLHERMHIADLEAGLRAHLDELESHRFESKAACETVATVLSDSPHLRVVMNRLRSRSNEKYGCSREGKY